MPSADRECHYSDTEDSTLILAIFDYFLNIPSFPSILGVYLKGFRIVTIRLSDPDILEFDTIKYSLKLKEKNSNLDRDLNLASPDL